jgi:hypothetical protein
MSTRAALVASAVFVVVASVGAYLYYFHWTAPLLDHTRVNAYAYGPRESHIRDLLVHSGQGAEEELALIVSLVNEAGLSSPPEDPRLEDFALVLLRDDGLQYRLVPAGQDRDGVPLLALSEGGQEFTGYLRSQALADQIAQLQDRGDGLRTG